MKPNWYEELNLPTDRKLTDQEICDVLAMFRQENHELRNSIKVEFQKMKKQLQ